MKKIIALVMLSWLNVTCAQVAPFTYKIGSISIAEDESSLQLKASAPLKVAILPGGSTWPRFGLDDDGHLYVGGTIIDSATGKLLTRADLPSGLIQALPSGFRIEVNDQRFRISRAGKSCTFTREQLGLLRWKSSAEAFKDGNIKFEAHAQQLLALAARIGDDSRDKTYVINDIDVERCRISQTELGNPDLLVELGHSRHGGWWLTGSIEQTLLRSTDGRRWEKMALPDDISSLISSYIVNDKEIWLAAILPPLNEADPLLIHTSDGGKNWRNVGRGDPLLTRLPEFWLEGKRRLAMPVAP
ncbi:hypothetical protein [Massilia sp. METH4]|uniref:hypothetical protein n=1 Tax=Massilia sp. METH4 TaxID=3123041 RepID=UPI0030D5466F